jgi:hypothetical protein
LDQEAILMRWTSVVVVWFLAIASVLAAWWLWPDGSQGNDRVEPDAPTAIAMDSIARIDLDHNGQQWSFVRESDGWWQTLPFRHRMNTDLLMAIPSAAQSLTVRDAIDPQSSALPSAASLGLDPPVATLRLTGDASTGHAIREVNLGRWGMAGHAWVSRGDDGPVLVVDGRLHELLASEPPETWRDLRLFPWVSVDADRLERTVSGETLSLVRDGRRWRILLPLPTRADAQAVMQHLSEIAGVTADAVLLDQPSDISAFGLAPPVARVHVAGSGYEGTLLVGERVGGASQDRYAMIEGVPSILRISAKNVGRLLGDPTAFVDHMGTDVSQPDIAMIRIRTMGRDLMLERSLDQWREHGGGEVASSAVERLLTGLLATRAVEVALHDTYPQELEVAIVTLIDADGGPLDTVRLLREPLPPEALGRWALENGDRVLRILPEGVSLPVQPVDFGLTP